MKTLSVELTLEDLQDALRSYCQLRGVDPHSVFIVSHSKAIRVELFAGGIVESDEFRHRAIETKIKETT
jgi:hypothetical protein